MRYNHGGFWKTHAKRGTMATPCDNFIFTDQQDATSRMRGEGGVVAELTRRLNQVLVSNYRATVSENTVRGLFKDAGISFKTLRNNETDLKIAAHWGASRNKSAKLLFYLLSSHINMVSCDSKAITKIGSGGHTLGTKRLQLQDEPVSRTDHDAGHED